MKTKLNSKTTKSKATKVVKDIRRANRKLYSAEEKIRIVIEGLRGESSIAELCRKEGIHLFQDRRLGMVLSLDHLG